MTHLMRNLHIYIFAIAVVGIIAIAGVAMAEKTPDTGACDAPVNNVGHFGTQDDCKITSSSGLTLTVNNGYDLKRLGKSKFYGGDIIDPNGDPRRGCKVDSGEDDDISTPDVDESKTTGSCEIPLPDPAAHDYTSGGIITLTGIKVAYISPSDGHVGYENLGYFGEALKEYEDDATKTFPKTISYTTQGGVTHRKTYTTKEDFLDDLIDDFEAFTTNQECDLMIAGFSFRAERFKELHSALTGTANEKSTKRGGIYTECKKNFLTPNIRWEQEASTFSLGGVTYYIHDNRSPFWDTDKSIVLTHRDGEIPLSTAPQSAGTTPSTTTTQYSRPPGYDSRCNDVRVWCVRSQADLDALQEDEWARQNVEIIIDLTPMI